MTWFSNKGFLMAGSDVLWPKPIAVRSMLDKSTLRHRPRERNRYSDSYKSL